MHVDSIFWKSNHKANAKFFPNYTVFNDYSLCSIVTILRTFLSLFLLLHFKNSFNQILKQFIVCNGNNTKNASNNIQKKNTKQNYNGKKCNIIHWNRPFYRLNWLKLMTVVVVRTQLCANSVIVCAGRLINIQLWIAIDSHD